MFDHIYCERNDLGLYERVMHSACDLIGRKKIGCWVSSVWGFWATSYLQCFLRIIIYVLNPIRSKAESIAWYASGGVEA